jgi:septum formation protein
MTTPLILASASPRRKALLAEAGVTFQVVVAPVAESSSRALSIRELTTWNAARKAIAVARLRRNAVVLGADTLVSLGGELIGKPANLAEAAKILRRLSGREHQVCTAVCLCSGSRPPLSFCVVSHVRFRALDEEQIASYLAAVDPLDKAGAYAAQGDGRRIITRIRGSYTNVVGLPMGETLRALRSFGVTASASMAQR